MKKDKDLMKKEAEDLFEFPVNLVAPERIVRDPNKLKVDYMVLARFCALGANLSESAFSLGTTIKALEIRIKKDLDMSFFEFQGYYSQFIKISLRRTQLRKAIQMYDSQMLKWLGKQYLGQTEDGLEEAPMPIDVPQDDLIKIARGDAHEKGRLGNDANKPKDNNKHKAPAGGSKVQGEKSPTGIAKPGVASGSGKATPKIIRGGTK